MASSRRGGGNARTPQPAPPTAASAPGDMSDADRDALIRKIRDWGTREGLDPQEAYDVLSEGELFGMLSAAKTKLRAETNPVKVWFLHLELDVFLRPMMTKRRPVDPDSQIIIGVRYNQVDLGADDLSNIYVILGWNPAIVALGNILVALPRHSTVTPASVMGVWRGSLYSYNEGLHWTQDPPFVIQFASADLDVVMCSTSVKWTEKIVSMLYHLYPHTRLELSTRFTVVTVDEYVKLNGPIGTTTLQNLATPAEKRFPILLGLLFLGPSWSRDDNLAKQVKSRVDAALASVGVAGVDLNHVEEVRNAIGFEKCFGNPDIEDSLGYWVAVDNEGRVNHEVTADTMGSAPFLARAGGWTGLQEAVYKQARMVYSLFKTSTIRFARTMVDALQGQERTMGDDVAAEIEKLKQAFQKMDKMPYFHLRGTIPEETQIMQFPKLCYLGLLYHQRNLVDPKDKSEFGNYITTGPKNYISKSDDLRTLEDYVNYLPTPTIRTLIRMAMTLDTQSFAQIVINQPAGTMEKIYSYIRLHKFASPWADDMYKQKKETQKIKELQTWRDLALRRIQEKYSTAMNLLFSIEDHDERMRKQRGIEDWAQRRRTSVDGILNSVPRVSTGLLDYEIEASAEADGLFDAEYILINQGPPQ